MAERSPCLVITGWLLFFGLFAAQVVLFVLILTKNSENGFPALCVISFLPTILVLIYFFRVNFKENRSYVEKDNEVWLVAGIWLAYIVAFTVTVITVFCTVAKCLTKSDDFGIHALMGTLCITPAQFILLVQLAICPSYQAPVLTLSTFTSLDIFDSIEMLQIILEQKEGNFTLGRDTEICIVFFACFNFVLTPFGLIRKKFAGDGKLEERKVVSIVFYLVDIFGTNLPFLILRSVVWYKYEAVAFIAKNIIAVVIFAIEFGISLKWCKCGKNPTIQNVSAKNDSVTVLEEVCSQKVENP